MYEEMRAVFERSFNDSRWRIADVSLKLVVAFYL